MRYMGVTGARVVVGAVALWAFASFASPASAALLGPRDVSAATANTAFAGVGVGWTYTNAVVRRGAVRSPFAGRIKRWRVNIPEPYGPFVNNGPLRLQVLKRTVNHPGVVNDAFKAVRQGPAQSVTPGFGKQAFNINMRIRKGQFIGLLVPEDTRVAAREVLPSSAHLLFWDYPLVPGSGGATATYQFAGHNLLFNATVRR